MRRDGVEARSTPRRAWSLAAPEAAEWPKSSRGKYRARAAGAEDAPAILMVFIRADGSS